MQQTEPEHTEPSNRAAAEKARLTNGIVTISLLRAPVLVPGNADLRLQLCVRSSCSRVSLLRVDSFKPRMLIVALNFHRRIIILFPDFLTDFPEIWKRHVSNLMT